MDIENVSNENIIFTTGNLLDSDCDILFNTVNCVGVMGKGLALQFKEKFKDTDYFEHYKWECKQGIIKPGMLGFYWSKEFNKIIVNFPTKDNWRNKSKIVWIEQGLQNWLTSIDCRFGIIYLTKLIDQDRNKLTVAITPKTRFSVAIPKLGCNNGGLDWNIVRERVIRYLSKDHSNKFIYYIYE